MDYKKQDFFDAFGTSANNENFEKFNVFSEKDINFANNVILGFEKALTTGNKKIIILFDIDETIGAINIKGETEFRPVLKDLLHYLADEAKNKDISLSYGLLSTRSPEEITTIKKQLENNAINFSEDFLISSNKEKILNERTELSIMRALKDGCSIEDLTTGEINKIIEIINIADNYPDSTIISVDDWPFEQYLKSNFYPVIGVYVDSHSDLR
jgi:hypothetical protein